MGGVVWWLVAGLITLEIDVTNPAFLSLKPTNRWLVCLYFIEYLMYIFVISREVDKNITNFIPIC